MLILCECTHEALIKWILLISVDIFLFPAIWNISTKCLIMNFHLKCSVEQCE